MSHFKERAEKNCLNCNTEVHGRFCHICGQENTEPTDTVWGLVSHFFHDLTHFDGKFFTSLKLLITKPGFLSKEYVVGRRARHLNPIRMYVFTSALFFILFFSFFFSVKDFTVKTSPPKKNNPKNLVIPAQVNNDTLARSVKKQDTGRKEESYRYVNKFADSIKGIEQRKFGKKKTDTTTRSDSTGKQESTKRQYNYNDDDNRGGFNLFYDTDQYNTVEQYDSAQRLLSPEKRDGWLARNIKRKEIHIDEKMKKEGNSAVVAQWMDKFMHSFPQILFLSLPLIALILQLLYIRRRKQFYYVNHGIFLIHIFIYSFINLLVYFSVDKLKDALGWEWLVWVKIALVLYAIWYVYKAMRNFYGQRRLKTVTKFVLLNILTIVVINILFIIFFLFSAWNL